MSTTSKSCWTRAESAAAALFGARRQVLSGSSNRDDRCSSDSTHETLFIETKLRERHAVWAIWEKARKLAKKGKIAKTPIVILREKGKHGMLICVHSEDFERVAVEYLAARDETAILEFEAAVRRARGII